MPDRAIIEEMLGAANEANGHARTIWVTFLLFGTYLAIAVGSTTHRDILLENRVTLPLLGVGLDFVTFYWVAPLLFVIYHLYTLVAHYVLAGKLHAFNSAVSQASMPNVVRNEFRMRVHPYVVAQSIAGPHRGRLPGMAMRLITWITLALAPVVLLLAFQIRFLPYHDPFWTWGHRGLLLADLALVWALWPLILHPSGRWSGLLLDIVLGIWRLPGRLIDRAKKIPPLFGRSRQGFNRWAALKSLLHWYADFNRETRDAVRAIVAFVQLGVASLVVALFSIVVATVPDERVEKYALRVALEPKGIVEQWISYGLSVTVVNDRQMLDLTAELFDGSINSKTRRPETPFSRNLVVIDEDIVGIAKRVRFRDRDLRFAILDFSRLADADLTAANLLRASLVGADLTKADMASAILQGADLSDTKLQSGSLICAKLQDAILSRAQLQGANFSQANLLGADLSGAELQGANFSQPNPPCPDLKNAKMQDSNFLPANLLGTKLSDANMQGTDLSGAKLQGANLRHADLRGADLSNAKLRGADLSHADLQGANLENAKLEGASLGSALLQGANLRDASLGGAGIGANLRLADLRGAKFVPLTEDEWDSLKFQFGLSVPGRIFDPDNLRLAAWKRFERAVPTDTFFPDYKKGWDAMYDPAPDSNSDAPPWPLAHWPTSRIGQDVFLERRATLLMDLACKNKYIAQGIATQIHDDILNQEPDSPVLGNALLARANDGKGCPSVAALSSNIFEDIKKLIVVKP